MSTSLFQKDTVNRWEYDKESNVFYCDDLYFEPVLPVIPEYDIESFEFYILHNEKLIGENCIFSVFFDNERVGWVFPIQALLSKEHDYSSNKHFLKYVYPGLLWLLRHLDQSYYSDTGSDLVFPDQATDLILMMIDKENAKKVQEYDIKNYTVSLFQKGYSYEGIGNTITEIDHPDKAIRLKRVSKELQHITFVDTLFRSYIPNMQDGITRFHMLYQVIEILIEQVFDSEFRKLVKCLTDDPGSMFDKRDDLGSIANEKTRVKRLFSNYVQTIDTNKKQFLEGICEKILNENGKEKRVSMEESLYAVRCLIVHKYYSLKTENMTNNLDELNSAFLDVLFDLLLGYRAPESSEVLGTT